MIFEKLKKNKKVLLIIYLPIAFVATAGIWYTPILFKGSPAIVPAGEAVVLGRNYALTGVLGMENELNVVVSSDELDQVKPTALGKKFTAYSYALIFKIFGWLNWEELILASILLFSAGAVIFTLTVYHLFGMRAAFLFPLVYALLPFMSETVQFFGRYEFALFYFSLFTLLYFWGRDRRYRLLCLVLSGIFLALACLSSEAMFIFLPIFFFWLILRTANIKKLYNSGWLNRLHVLWQAILGGFKQNRKELMSVFIPAALLISFFWLPSFIGANGVNNYLKYFVTTDEKTNNWSEFQFYGHIYPDPYTYHFDANSVREQLKEDLSGKNRGLLFVMDRLKVGKNMGINDINIFHRFFVGTGNLISHLSRFFAIEFIGGPLVFLLMLMGFWHLKRQNKEMCYFFTAWLLSVTILLSYGALVIRSHLMDFGWVIAALIAVALAGVPLLLKTYFRFDKFLKLASVAVILVVLYSLVLANHVYFGRAYDKNAGLAIKYLVQKVDQEKNIVSGDVIAVGDISLHPFLGYLTDRSVVYFNPSTVAKLVKEQKLQQAFDRYGIKYFIGYGQTTTGSILKNSQAVNIAAWPSADQIKEVVSYNKMWILNLIK